ncbi:MAG: sensor domain-containing diguanylate cyclase [Candidatus Omnitrophica bacterium]|nr:sensor domain-containing diguanylate cyclase [Candidatus Omnitrophota bacterium]
MLFYFYRSYLYKKNIILLHFQDLQENINLLNRQIRQELHNADAYKIRIRHYQNLRDIVEAINKEISLDFIGDSLAHIAFSTISNGKGNCILYLVDPRTQRLSIFKTKKEDRGLFIKDKEGDIFDVWVMRNSIPLLVEDIRKDFRFNLDKLNQHQIRPIGSLISSPLISENKFLGVLRLDSAYTGFYSQEDLRFLVTICDLGAIALEISQLFQVTQDLAIHDSLTGLYTKGYFLDRLRQECKRYLRRLTKFSLVMIDIDHFKEYNDKFGHTSGDLLLKQISQDIVSSLKEDSYIIGRFGGEEFCVILLDLDKKDAHNVAEDLRKKIGGKVISLRRQKTNVTVSIGVATFPDDAKDEEELILKADRALYEAKQRGRNKVIDAH